MKKLLIFALALGAIYAGAILSRRGSAPPKDSDIDQWEREGGAVPVAAERIAAQTHSIRSATN